MRFANADPVWQVDDRQPIAQPTPQGFPKLLYYFDRFFLRRTTRLMEIPEPAHAGNVNSVDGVPDSTWFTNRVGRYALTPAQVRRGPNLDDGPDRSGPWVIKGTKVGGASVGLLMTDPRGERYILKFDERGVPEIETAANVVVQRLMWAAGFNVPEDNVVTFPRSQLVLADDAVVSDTFGNKRRMTEADLAAALRRVDVHADGSYRGMASKFLHGVPLGGVEPEGVRADDPNDVVAHEERRELRGQYVMFAWVDHTDVKLDNMLDMYVADPGDPKVKYVVHYLVDFGKALGAMGWIERRPGDGFAHLFDFEQSAKSVLSLGLWRRPWEGADGPGLRGVARFEAGRFQANNWRPQYPWEPFARLDRFDGFWGAKIVAAFSDDMIRAAVAAGRYSDPKAADYVARTLMARRDKIARYWFDQVAPLDRFDVEGDALCFDDLARKYRVSQAPARYRALAYDWDGARLAGGASVEAGDASRVCMRGLPVGVARDGYTIVSIATRRGGHPERPVEVHLARNGAGALRVIGLVRR